MSNQFLLIEDVETLGRSGDIVSVKPGYARNFLLPKKRAVVVTKQTLRMQAHLQEERAKRALNDRKASEELAERLQGMTLEIEVKVDPEGHMYGSVSAMDIVKLFAEKEVQLERHNVLLPQPLKQLGTHNLTLRLKEGVTMPFVLVINSDIPLPKKTEAAPVEEQPQQETKT